MGRADRIVTDDHSSSQFSKKPGWFEKATMAKRYDSKHFPYLNLARVYLKKGDMMKAVENFGKALELNPSSEEAKLLLAELDKDGDDKKEWFMQFYSDN